MKKSTFTRTQIAGILKELEGGKSAEQIHREHGVSRQICFSPIKPAKRCATDTVGQHSLYNIVNSINIKIRKTSIGKYQIIKSSFSQ